MLWDFRTLKEKARFKLHKVKVQSLSFSANERFLVSVGGQDDGSVVVWDRDKGAARWGSPAASTAAGIAQVVRCCNKNDTVFVTAGDSTIRVWEIDVDNRKLRPTDVSLGALRRYESLCLVGWCCAVLWSNPFSVVFKCFVCVCVYVCVCAESLCI